MLRTTVYGPILITAQNKNEREKEEMMLNWLRQGLDSTQLLLREEEGLAYYRGFTFNNIGREVYFGTVFTRVFHRPTAACKDDLYFF